MRVQCPHCKKEPMVCPGCGHVNGPTCIKCEEWTYFNPENPEYSSPRGGSINDQNSTYARGMTVS